MTLKEAVRGVLRCHLPPPARMRTRVPEAVAAKGLAQQLSDVCDRRDWTQLPGLTAALEQTRAMLADHASDTSDEFVAESCRQLSEALRELREAAMAEMSKGLCR